MKYALYSMTLVLLNLFIFPLKSEATIYESSTLHNSIKRSETVQDIFIERWDKIIQESLYFDLYGRINWVNGFKVNTQNQGSGEIETTDLTLVRTYGGISINFPILGSDYLQSISDRFDIDDAIEAEIEKYDKSPNKKRKKNKKSPRSWQDNDLIIGLTTAGFHYGLTRQTSVYRGDAGKDEVTDYKYTQFFDDIYAVSLLFIPYIYLHCGIVCNNQIVPEDDGTIDYGSSIFIRKRIFLASSLFSFLNTTTSITKMELESIAISLNVNTLLSFFYNIPAWSPVLTIGYKRIDAYNDELWDTVWVSKKHVQGQPKNESGLNLYTLLVKKDLDNIFFTSLNVEFQSVDKTLVDKRTNQKIDVAPVKKMEFMVGLNTFALIPLFIHKLMISGGLSYFWDPGIPIYKESGSGYSVWGWIGKLEYSTPWGGVFFMINRNFSNELWKLIESTDKLAIEAGINFRI